MADKKEEKKETEVEQTPEEKVEKNAQPTESAGPVEETPAEKSEEKSDQPAEESKPEPKPEKKAAPTGQHADLIKKIESMSVADLAELVKALEERFGVSAATPVATVSAAQSAQGAPPQEEEKSSYTVVLKDGGAQKIAAIKAVREINQDLGLKEAKDLVEGAPKEVKKDIPKDEAEEAKKKLEAAGATVELV